MEREKFNHLCKLARLQLDDSEVAEFEKKFERLLGFVDLIQEYEPQSEGKPLTLIDKLELRRDTPATCDWPDFYDHKYNVPQVIDFEDGS